MFLFEVPRLSVDIDLNYIGAADRQTMKRERPKVDQAIRAVCERQGYEIRRVPEEYAGGKWRLAYQTVDGRPGILELDLNFMLRVPLWPIRRLTSIEMGSIRIHDVPVLDVHELTAGKLSALLDRTASRDLFDVRELLRRDDLDTQQLRTAFVVYGGMSRRDWRTVQVADIQATVEDVDRRLVPLLRHDLMPDREERRAWSEKLASDCRLLLSRVLPLAPREIEFLDRLNDKGEVAPERLTSDAAGAG